MCSFIFLFSSFSFSSCYHEFEVNFEKEFFNDDLSGLKIETNEFPKNYSHQIVNPVIFEDFIKYSTDESVDSRNFNVKRYNTILSLRGDISKFPFDSDLRRKIESNYEDYLVYSDSITKIADEIELTDNSLKNVFRMSDFVHNYIKYDRNVTEVQSIDQIINRKTGVCFHYSVLLVDLLRYFGYPAREMNGFAYSNIYDEFEGHSWVEVFVPDIGWIEVDPTFGENYYVSSNRVFISYGDIRTRFEWRGGSSLDYSINRYFNELSSDSKSCFKNVYFNLDVSPKEVNFGSQVLINLEIENKNPYHLFYPLSLSTPSELNFSLREHFFVEANSVSKESFVIDIPKTFDDNYIYTLPIILSDRFGNRKESNVKVSKTFSDYQISLDDKSKTDLIISLDCNNNQFYLFEDENVSCFISHNSLEIESFEIDFVYDNEIIFSDKINVGVNTDKKVSFDIINDSIGVHDFEILVNTKSFENVFKNDYEILEGYVDYDCSYDIKETKFICDVNSSFPYSFSVFQNDEQIFLENYKESKTIEIDSRLDIVPNGNLSKNVFDVDLSARTSKGNYIMSRDYNYYYKYSYFEYIVYRIERFLNSLIDYLFSF